MKIWYDSEMDMYITDSDIRCAYSVDVKRGFPGDFKFYLSILSHTNGGPLYTIDERIMQLAADDAGNKAEELENALRIRSDFA